MRTGFTLNLWDPTDPLLPLALHSFPGISESVLEDVRMLGTLEYILAVAIIGLGCSGHSDAASSLISFFVFITICWQRRITTRFRNDGNNFIGDPFTSEAMQAAFNVLDEPATIMGQSLPISHSTYKLIMSVPTSIQALTTVLILGQALPSWTDALQQKWSKGWWFCPLVGSLGLPWLLLTFKIIAYSASIYLGRRKFLAARKALRDNPAFRFLDYFKALTDAADCMNLLVLSDTTSVISGECHRANINFIDDPNAIAWAAARGSRFTAKVMIGACAQLWLKISLFALTFDEIVQSRLELASMFLAIACSYYTILQQVPVQWQFARIDKVHAHDDYHYWREGSQVCFALLILGLCAIRLGGLAYCPQHYLNVIFSPGCV